MAGIVSTETPREQLETIRLSVPARASFAQITRLTATSVAARIGFSYDEVEDVRIAVGELCGILVDEPGDSRMTITCTADGDALVIEAVRVPAGDPVDVTPLSDQILRAVTDDVVVDADAASVTVRKSRQG